MADDLKKEALEIGNKIHSFKDKIEKITDRNLNKGGGKELGVELAKLGDCLDSVLGLFGKVREASCAKTEDNLYRAIENEDILDDYMQKGQIGKLKINITDEQLKKDIVPADEENYKEINVTNLTKALSARYEIELKNEDLSEARRINTKGDIIIEFIDK